MSAIVLRVDASHDATMRYFHAWGRAVDAENPRENVRIVSIFGNQLNRHAVQSAIDEHVPHCVCIHAHGSETVMANGDDVPVFDLENVQVLAGAIVHALSCWTGRIFGPAAVLNGARAYIGYTAPFMLWHRGIYDTEERWMDDELAHVFLNPAFQVERALLDGRTAGEAHNLSKRAHIESLQALIKGNVPSEYAADLYSNFKHQILLGDENVAIS